MLLIGVSHTANTAIHLAEQRFGAGMLLALRQDGRFVWIELPNIPGESDGFDTIESALVWSVTLNFRSDRAAFAR